MIFAEGNARSMLLSTRFDPQFSNQSSFPKKADSNQNTYINSSRASFDSLLEFLRAKHFVIKVTQNLIRKESI